MKLWLLEAKHDLPKDDNPWEPWFNKIFSFVIRAETEDRARQLAQESAADEGNPLEEGSKTAWLDQKYSDCTELLSEGSREVILHDRHRA